MGQQQTIRCKKCGQPLTQVGNFLICPNHGEQSIEKPSSPVPPAATESHPLLTLSHDLPFPLALIIRDYLSADNPFIKLHRLTDGAELLTRFVTIIVLSDLLRLRGEYPESIRKELAERIERPTFGAWRNILGSACEELFAKKRRAECFVTELPAYVKGRLLPALGGNEGDATNQIIALRNILAHQGRLGDDQAQEFLVHHQPSFETLMVELGFLKDYDLIACAVDGHVLSLRGIPQTNESFPSLELPKSLQPLWPERVALLRGAEWLDLFPLQAFSDVFRWRDEQMERVGVAVPQIYFRLSGKGYLEFTPLSGRVTLAQQRGAALDRFRELFRLEEWRRMTEAERQRGELMFSELVAELSEVFVGREAHVQQVKDYLKGTDSGVLWISGKPGVGKSALMTQLIQRYHGAQQYVVIPYFFRTGHSGCSADLFLKAALLHLSVAIGEPFDISTNPEKRRVQFLEAVKQASTRLNKKVLFLIDGLDEIYRLEPNFVSLPFTAHEPKVVWLCAGRTEPALKGVLEAGGAKEVFPEGLPEMDESGIRAMLTAHLEGLKYPLFERDEVTEGQYRNRFVEVLTHKSERLPLYVRMVIEDLREGRWTLSDEDKLPEGLRAYFEQVLERLGVGSVGTILTPLFCLLAWAKEPVTEPALQLLLSKHHLGGEPEWGELLHQALDHGHLMLRPAPTPEGETGWTFYHDAFRQHLLTSTRVRADRNWAQKALLERCARWQHISEESLLRYVLRHSAEHLREAKRWGELYELSRDDAFKQKQSMKMQGTPDLPLRTAQTALLGAAENDDAGAMAEFLLSCSRRLLEVTQESPLDALRAGQLERAWVLADLHDIELCVLWHLLLTWELKDEGEVDKARATLERLQRREIPSLSRHEVAFYLFRQVFDHRGDDPFSLLHAQYLDHRGRWYLCGELTKAGNLAGVLEVAEMLQREDKESALINIAEAYARAGRFQEASNIAQAINFRTCQEYIESVGENRRGRLLAYLAKRHTLNQEFAEALKLVLEIRSPKGRADALGMIIWLQALAVEHTPLADEKITEQIEDAIETATARAIDGDITGAVETAQTIGISWCRAITLGAIAAIQSAIHGDEEARPTFLTAIETASSCKEEHERIEAMLLISLALAARAAITTDRNTTQSAALLLNVAWLGYSEYQEVNDNVQAPLNASLQIACTLKDEAERAKTLRLISEAQASMGEFVEANKTAQLITLENIREHISSVLQLTGAQEGESDEARLLTIIRNSALQMSLVEEIESAQQIFDEAIRIVEGISSSRLRIKSLSELALTQAEAGFIDAAKVTIGTAVYTAQQMEDSASCLTGLKVIALTQAELGDYEAAIQTSRAIVSESERAGVLKHIAGWQIVRGDIDAAERTVEFIEDGNVRAQASEFIDLARSAAERPKAGGSVIDQYPFLRNLAWEHLSPFPPGARSWVWGASPDPLLLSPDPPFPGPLSSETRIVLDDALARGFGTALQAALNIKNSEERESALQYVMDWQVCSGGITSGRQVLQFFEDKWGTTWEKWGRGEVLPDNEHMRLLASKDISNWADALRFLAQAQVRVGKFDDAIQTALMIGGGSEYSSALLFIVIKQAKAAGCSAARTTLATVLQAAGKVKVKVEKNAFLNMWKDIWNGLKDCAQAQTARGDFTGAFQTIGFIKGEEWCEPLMALATAQAQEGSFSAAFQTIKTAEEPLLALATWPIAIMQWEKGDREGARETLNTALQTIALIEDEPEASKAQAILSIALARAAMGDHAGALEAAGAITSPNLRALCQSGIASGLSKGGKRDAAHETFAAALKTASMIEEDDERAVTLSKIALNQWQAGEQSTARETFTLALETVSSIEGWQIEGRTVALESIAAHQAEAGEYAAALQTVALIGGDNHESGNDRAREMLALENIAYKQAIAGECAAAVQTTRLMGSLIGAWKNHYYIFNWDGRVSTLVGENTSNLEKTLRFIAVRQALTGDLDSALQTTQEIERPHARSMAESDVALALSKAGKGESARNIFSLALKTARSVCPEEPVEESTHSQQSAYRTRPSDKDILRLSKLTEIQLESMKYLARVMAEAGEFESAIETVLSLGEDPKQVLASVIKEQVQSGKLEAARSTFAALKTALGVPRYDQLLSGFSSDYSSIRALVTTQAKTGFGEEIVTMTNALQLDRNTCLIEIAESLADAGDQKTLKRLLVPGTYYSEATYRMCGLLARLYPEQAPAVAAVVSEYFDM